jgi:uncharacterized Zn-binding protein involved in type VI secretion
MGQGAARQTDTVTATDIHIVLVPSASGSVPTPLPHQFSGTITSGTSSDVQINQLAAAIVGSVATNSPPHIPTPPGTSFEKPPSNQGTITLGSTSVLINNKAAARQNDVVTTCNDPVDLPVGTITTGSPDVLIG